jgi:hypothetical protein
MSADDHPNQPKRAAAAELILPAAGVLLALYYFSTIIDSPWEAQVGAFFVGLILIGLVAALVVKTGFDIRAGRAALTFGTLFNEGWVTRKRGGLFAVTLAYIVVIDYLGFTITSFLYLCAAMLLLDDRRRVRLVLPLAAAISLVGYLLFIVAFETRFPKGPFETFMQGLI